MASTSTRSPSAHRLGSTAEPVASTTPLYSMPGVYGGAGMCWYWPLVMSRSTQATPALLTPMSTSFGFSAATSGAGCGCSVMNFSMASSGLSANSETTTRWPGFNAMVMGQAALSFVHRATTGLQSLAQHRCRCGFCRLSRCSDRYEGVNDMIISISDLG